MKFLGNERECRGDLKGIDWVVSSSLMVRILKEVSGVLGRKKVLGREKDCRIGRGNEG